jgi:hypothetical protein
MGLEAHGQSTLMMLPTMIDILPTGCDQLALLQMRLSIACAIAADLESHCALQRRVRHLLCTRHGRDKLPGGHCDPVKARQPRGEHVAMLRGDKQGQLGVHVR